MSARSKLKKKALTLALTASATMAVIAPAAQAQEYVKAVTQYSYDANGRLVCTAVRMTRSAFNAQPDACVQSQPGATDPDRITKTEYDKLGRALQVRHAVGTPIEQAYSTSAYSDNGKVVDTIDAKGNRSHYVYDAYDRLQSWYFPSPAGPSGFNSATAATATATAGGYNSADYEAYDYDANDNRTDWQRRETQSSTVRMIGTAFDKLNRPITKNVWASADIAATTYDYAYDNLGRMTSAIEGGREIVSAYDVQGLNSETTKQGGVALWSVNYAYDAAGRRDTLTWPDNVFVKYGYNNASALKTLKRAGTDTLVTFAYDDLDRRWTITRGNGVTTTYDYDPDTQRLSSLAHTLPTAYAADNVSFGFNTNIAGQITRRTISNPSFVWQPVGLEKAYGANGLNQISSVGGQTLTYDGRGNLKSDGAATYQYDLENRLRGQGAASLTYDPLGRLFETKTGGAPDVVTRYVYDGPNLIAEYTGDGIFQRRYVHGPGADEPLVQYMDSGTTPEYLLADHQGSIIAATAANGSIATATVGTTTVRKILTYGEYGQPGPSNQGLFQYTGQTYLANLGLYNYKARAYSPVYGRFLQTDPAGYDDGLNWYAYVGNDPLNKVDPTGQSWRSFVQGFSDGNVDTQFPFQREHKSGESGASYRVGYVLGVMMTAFSATADVKGGVPGWPEATVAEPITTIKISRTRYPEAAKHIEDAQAAGQPSVLTVDRAGAAARRREAMRGQPAVPNKDRDEYPPAVTAEGGSGSSVRPIARPDNRGAGSSMGHQCRAVPDGGKIQITVCD